MEDRDGAQIAIYSIPSFEPHWQPATSSALHAAAAASTATSFPMPIPNIVPILLQTIPYPVVAPLSPNAIMSVYECLLCADSWIVAAYFSLWKPGDVRGEIPHQAHSMYYRYRLAFPHNSNSNYPASAPVPAWNLLTHSTNPDLVYLDGANLSYAGYGLTQERDSSPRTLHSVFAPPEGVDLRPMPLPRSSLHNDRRRVPLEAKWTMSLERYSAAVVMPLLTGDGQEITYYV